MLNSHVVALARKVVPQTIVRRLDPFEAAIESFVSSLARNTAEGMVVLDAGAGECRFSESFSHANYISIDFGLGDSDWDYSRLDMIGRLESLPLADGSCDRVLSEVVLEHTAEPGHVIDEFRRVLKPGGSVHMVVPLMWEEHQRPHDYFRYTSAGIRYLLERSGFTILSIRPVGGFFWQLGRRLMGVLTFTQQGWRWILFPFLAPVFGLLLPLFCYYLDTLDKDQSCTLGYICEGSRE